MSIKQFTLVWYSNLEVLFLQLNLNYQTLELYYLFLVPINSFLNKLSGKITESQRLCNFRRCGILGTGNFSCCQISQTQTRQTQTITLIPEVPTSTMTFVLPCFKLWCWERSPCLKLKLGDPRKLSDARKHCLSIHPYVRNLGCLWYWYLTNLCEQII